MKEFDSIRRVAFAFSDTAGANACFALCRILRKENAATTVVYSNNQAYRVNTWSESVIITDQLLPSHLKDVGLLFTGSSHPDTSAGFELKAIEVAHEVGVETVSFVDHWTSIGIRFDLGEKRVYPSRIWVLDEVAKARALIDNIPDRLLHIHQNPYHTYIRRHWQSSFKPEQYAVQLSLPAHKKLIVIAPDPVSLRAETRGYGFSEVETLNDLLEILTQVPDSSSISVVVKPHPVQPPHSFDDVIAAYVRGNLDVRQVLECDSLELINISEIVIGFYSNFLLEAHALDKKVLRYFPGEASRDPLRHLDHLPAIGNRDKALLTLQGLLT